MTTVYNIPDTSIYVSWTRESNSSPYTLTYTDGKEEVNGCGNPWNLLQHYPELDNEIRKAKPKPDLSLYHCDVQTKMVKGDKIRDLIIECVGGDCWNLFLRDPSNPEFTQTLYDTDILPNERQYYMEPSDKLSDVLDEIGNGKELVVTYGRPAWRNDIIQSVKGSDDYILTTTVRYL